MTCGPRPSLRIAPSLLSANLLCLGQEMERLEEAGADWFHIDIMDGHYVPNLTFGPDLVAALRTQTSRPLDVHLMTHPVSPWIERFAQAGASHLTFHPETEWHPHRVLSQIRHHGLKAGVALTPSAPWENLSFLWEEIDLILVMTVNPGFGGQSFLPALLKKIEGIRRTIDAIGRPILLQVDGGINAHWAPQVRNAGADVLVVGSALFQHPPHGYSSYLSQLKGEEEKMLPLPSQEDY